MSGSGLERKLVSILIADIVGYSRLMSDDEEGTLSTIKSIQSDVLDPALTVHRGRVVKRMGDGLLIVFESVVDAVAFAVEYQKEITDFNLGLAPNRQVHYRIGVNLGDVVIDEDEIIGEGVKIASRLEEIAEPGGICVSATVCEQVRGKLNIELRDLGERQVKNLPAPIRVYSIVGTGAEAVEDVASARERAAIKHEQELIEVDFSIPETPSIAVLPFTNMSADPDQDYFSDGITEDIITALSKINDLMVVARNSTFIYKNRAVDVKQVSEEQGVRYVLEGSVRKAGNRVRITAQLIDADTGLHLWAERFDRDLEDVFAVQDEITKEVAVAMDIKLRSGGQAQMWSRGTQILEAWESIRRSMDLLNEASPENFRESIELCNRALELDPEYPFAWVCLGWVHHHGVEVEIKKFSKKERETAMQKAEECGRRALELDGNCTDAYSLISMCKLSARKFDEAMEMAEKAVEVASNHAETLGICAMVMNKSGHPDRANALIRKAMRFCPVYPGWFVLTLAMSHRLIGDLDKAIRLYRLAVKRSPGYMPGYVNLASTMGEAGRLEDAATVVADITKIDPQFSVSGYMDRISYSDPEVWARFRQGLVDVGLPE